MTTSGFVDWKKLKFAWLQRRVKKCCTDTASFIVSMDNIKFEINQLKRFFYFDRAHHFLDRIGLQIALYGVVFHGEDARDVQKCVALQNNMKNKKNCKTNSSKVCNSSGTGNFRGIEK